MRKRLVDANIKNVLHMSTVLEGRYRVYISPLSASFWVIIQFISFLSYICWHVTQSFYASITLYFPCRSVSPSDCSLHAGFKQDCLIRALIAPLVFIPQVAIYIRAKYKCDIRKVVIHAILSGILTILSSLLMLM